MDSKQPARALCYACPKGHVVMFQLPTVPVEVGLLLSVLVQKAIIFECLQLNTQKSSLIFEYLQKPDKAAKTQSADWERDVSSNKHCSVPPAPMVLFQKE